MSSWARRLLVVSLAAALTLVSSSASAITWKRDGNGDIAVVSADDGCPTFSSPPAYSGWFNIADMEQRGYWDGRNPAPWDYARKLSQVVCGAAKGAHIEIGMYFIRALGTMDGNALGSRPESDTELVWKALAWVKANRGVSVGMIIDGGKGRMPEGDKEKVEKRLGDIATIRYCKNGCLNTNKSSVYRSSINHEKFITISDTVWGDSDTGPHPAVLSLSGNLSRSQLRWYHQEVTLVYDDKELYRQFDARYDDMVYCAKTGCASGSGFSGVDKLSKQRGIWVDPLYRHYTDAGRGTTVSFSPQPKTVPDFYISQFDGVDCAVDKDIRVAMFKLTDSKATRMAKSMASLQKRGCNVKLLLTFQGGNTTISKTVLRTLKKAKVTPSCVKTATHTKMILIGPPRTNEGRALVGTQNMSTAGLRYSEEHVLTFDTRRASDKYVESMRRLYSDYMNGWYEMSRNTRSCG